MAYNLNLDFAALRAANIARLPLFKNKHGQPAHSEPDGSDWSPAQWLQAVVGELGEYANLRKKYDRGDISETEFYPEACDELADVQCYLDILAFQLGIDLGAATVSKWNRISERVGCDVRLAATPAPASDEVLATVQIDIPDGVATVSFEEADMYGGLTAWLRAKGYIGKDEDGEDETEDDITHWAGPNVSRAHYTTLTENTALLARVRQAQAFKVQVIELLAVRRDAAHALFLEDLEENEGEGPTAGAEAGDEISKIAQALGLTLPETVKGGQQDA